MNQSLLRLLPTAYHPLREQMPTIAAIASPFQTLPLSHSRPRRTNIVSMSENPADPADDRRRQAWREIMGNDPPDDLSDLYLQFTSDLFVNVWTRPGLSRRDRRLITLTAVATRGSPEALPHHIKAALQLGDLSPEELSEWIVHLAHYAGWPASAEAYIALQIAQAETDS